MLTISIKKKKKKKKKLLVKKRTMAACESPHVCLYCTHCWSFPPYFFTHTEGYWKDAFALNGTVPIYITNKPVCQRRWWIIYYIICEENISDLVAWNEIKLVFSALDIRGANDQKNDSNFKFWLFFHQPGDKVRLLPSVKSQKKKGNERPK